MPSSAQNVTIWHAINVWSPILRQIATAPIVRRNTFHQIESILWFTTCSLNKSSSVTCAPRNLYITTDILTSTHALVETFTLANVKDVMQNSRSHRSSKSIGKLVANLSWWMGLMVANCHVGRYSNIYLNNSKTNFCLKSKLALQKKSYMLMFSPSRSLKTSMFVYQKHK